MFCDVGNEGAVPCPTRPVDVMFSARVKFEGGNGTKYSADNVKATYGRIDTAATPGYFTEK